MVPHLKLGAWDLDFVAYKAGIHEPRSQGGGSPIFFEEQPVSLTLNEGETATFSAKVTGTPPRELQWQRDGVDILDATTATLELGQVLRTDDGAVFTLVATNPFGTEVSDPATLTVIPDTAGPQIVSVSSADGIHLGVCTDDLLDPDVATDPFNWEINGGTIFALSATLLPDGRSVVLELADTDAVSGTFGVDAIGLTDLFGNSTPITSGMGNVWLEGVVDIGAPDPAGSNFSCADGEITVSAGGADIWGTTDQFTYAYETKVNNFDVKVRVNDVPYVGNANSKGGLNIRASLDANSPMVWINPTPTPPGANTIQYGVRATAGASVADVGQPRPNVNDFPIWLRVRRVGSVFTAFYSRDGVAWTQNGSPQDLPDFPAQL